LHPSLTIGQNSLMTSPSSTRRLLLVHAHPDDETINNGATMAKYVAEGIGVTLITCTRGEEGEVLVPELAHLASHVNDELGSHRETELANAMAALGVTDFRFLGTPTKKYRDSGMMGTEPNNRPDVFWQADVDEAAADLVKVIREVKPQVMVTYDEFGGYGHPDHIQAHRVAMRAAELAQPDWEISKIYWNAMPRSVMARGIEKMKEVGSDFWGVEVVTSVVNAPEFAQQKIEAMKAHPTQMSLDGPFFALSNNLGSEVMGDEYYTLVKGVKAGPFDQDGRETDLFNGIEV
jgi:N-acetyl-1-D-myo-inositol-2-amino-2-deoxy-alpha-D-glucopyranoside deacetylase